jgi:predicted ATPase
MVYIERFEIPDDGLESAFLSTSSESRRTCYGSSYPFGVFSQKEFTQLDFEPITILCGGNGSGKTTLLNLIGEKLELQRGAVFNRSSFYEDYLHLCKAEVSRNYNRGIRANSWVITSDDVFDYLLDFRYINENIDQKRQELLAEYADKRYAKMQLHSLEDLDELRKVVDARRSTGSRYVKDRVMNDIPGKSNGESAFLYFTRKIKENALYLLDEPENSLSAQLQLELKQFLEDSARFYGCQFVIATHSPFLLSIKGARVYDLDSTPVVVRRWTELDNVRTFYDFFQSHKNEFEANK